MKKWKLNSWRNYPVKHIPKYEDEKELNMVLNKIKNFPPLVFAGETRHLKQQLADVVDGKAFLLQGGDCAESFAEFNPDNIRDFFKYPKFHKWTFFKSANPPWQKALIKFKVDADCE